MERYFVDYKLHNKENNGWAYNTTKSTENYDIALKDFHAQCANYVGGTTFDHVVIVLSDAMGIPLKSEVWYVNNEIK